MRTEAKAVKRPVYLSRYEEEEREAIQDESCGRLAIADVGPIPRSTPPECVAILKPRSREAGEREPTVPDNSSPERQIEPQGSGETLSIQWMSTAEIFAPRPPVPWIVPGLQLCAGRPIMFAGRGSAGKTILMQSLALSLASGLPVWQRFPVSSPVTVGHLDFDQGEGATCRRYQRLAAGLGIWLPDIAGRLIYRRSPKIRLNDSPDKVYDVFARESELVKVFIIDSLRAACPGSDENDSRFRAYVDVLSRVSDNVGSVFILVHHAGKPREDGSHRPTPRGSSAIVDACGCTFTVSGELNGPKTIEQTKLPAEASGGGIADMLVHFEDLNGGALRVVCGEEAHDRVGRAKEGNADSLLGRVLKAIEERPGMHGEELRAAVAANASDVREAVDLLVEMGKVVKKPGRGSRAITHWSADQPSRPSPHREGTDRTDAQAVRDGSDGCRTTRTDRT